MPPGSSEKLSNPATSEDFLYLRSGGHHQPGQGDDAGSKMGKGGYVDIQEQQKQQQQQSATRKKVNRKRKRETTFACSRQNGER